MKQGRLTKEEHIRRLKILGSFMFNFRYATLMEIREFIRRVMELPSDKRLLESAVREGYLVYYVEPALRTRIYYLTKKGKDLIQIEEALVEYYRFEKSLTGINTYIHHRLLIETYLVLKTKIAIREWVCEWILRIGKTRREKIPDAVMVLPDVLIIALEVETRYKKQTVLKTVVAKYRYDIERLARYDACLVIASSELHYQSLKRSLCVIAQDFCSRRFIFTEMKMLNQGMSFYQGEERPLSGALALLKSRKFSTEKPLGSAGNVVQ